MERIKNSIDRTRAMFNETMEVNNALSLEFESSNRISLHLDDMEGKTSLLRGGFKKIALLLKNNPKFKNIKIISATSWIVTEKPNLMRLLGFTIDKSSELATNSVSIYKGRSKGSDLPEDKRELEPTYSYITRDRFLEIYG